MNETENRMSDMNMKEHKTDLPITMIPQGQITEKQAETWREQAQALYLFSRETAREHIKDLHDAATRFEDRAKRAESQRDELLAALKICRNAMSEPQNRWARLAAIRDAQSAIANAEGKGK